LAALDAADSKPRGISVRVTTLLNKLLNLQGLRVTGVRFEDGALILLVRRTFRRLTCPCCGHHKRGRESKRVRRWRHMSIWGMEVWIEGEIRRIRCDNCAAVRTEAVPWARHDSDFTRPFEDAVALLAQQTNKTAVAELTGISWVTVGNIAERVVAENLDPVRFQDLRRIGVDEISFRKRHRYLTVVTDHDQGRVVWVAEGKSSDVLKSFFTIIGREVCDRIEIVTMDMSAAYIKAVREGLPHAMIVFDHFHVAQLANEALNEVRRTLAREATDKATKDSIKGSMWATLHRMDNATDQHFEVLSRLRPEQPLGRGYLLKECLLDILRRAVSKPEPALRRWLSWAARSRLQPFVKLGRTIRNHLDGVLALLRERIANGLAEGMNNKIRLLSHRAYGFHSAPPLIAMIYLCCAGITLPDLQLL
jgi:transposase